MVIERLCSLYEQRAQDKIFACFEVPSLVLTEFREQNPEGFCSYPDPNVRIAFWDKLLAEHSAVEDDSMPNVYLSEFDQGLYGGLLGGDIQFMCHNNGWISSMVSPILDDWSEFNALSYAETHPWFQRYELQLKIFSDGSSDKFGISHFILIDGLNFVFELVGATETYMSVIESPELVRKAIGFGFDLNVIVQRKFFRTIPLFQGGTFSNFAQWIPGQIVSESVDPFHMTSLDYFEEWGRENIERMFAEFDGGVVHIHGNGRHLVERVCSLKGLKALLLLDDTGYPHAFDIVKELKKRAGDMPVSVYCEFDSFAEKLDSHQLPGGVLYQVTCVPDTDTANKCMDRVRAYRA